MLTDDKFLLHLSLSLLYHLSFYRSRITLNKGGKSDGREIKILQCQKENKWKYFHWQENFLVAFRSRKLSLT